MNENNSKFCQECGIRLKDKIESKQSITEEAPIIIETIKTLEEPPQKGITIEFPFSNAQSFDFAVECAKKYPTFRQFGEGKKVLYRITVDQAELISTMELVEHLKGWRKRTVYINGEKVPWDNVFQFTWCYERKNASYKPEYYCFGYENEYDLNMWGCMQAHLPFTENARWFCWGRWLNNNGDWQFDKEKIVFELQKELFKYRYCPAIKLELVDDVLNALPDVVNPSKDKNWKYVEDWGNENSLCIVISLDRFGSNEKVKMKGVSPNGNGALKEIIHKVRYRLPPGDIFKTISV